MLPPRLSRFFCSQKTMSGMWFWISLFPFYSPVLPLFCSPSLLFPSPFSSVLQLSLLAFFYSLFSAFFVTFLPFFLSFFAFSVFPFSSVLQLSLLAFFYFPFFYSLFFRFFSFFFVTLLPFFLSFFAFSVSLFLPSFNFPSHEPAAVWEASQAVSETSSGFCQVNE